MGFLVAGGATTWRWLSARGGGIGSAAGSSASATGGEGLVLFFLWTCCRDRRGKCKDAAWPVSVSSISRVHRAGGKRQRNLDLRIVPVII